jgi:hypothetical protein
MDINLTNNGIMMNNGSVISTDVAVDIDPDGSVKVSYTDEYDCERVDIRSSNDNGMRIMRNSQGIINSLLSKNDDYLVIWSND